MRNKITLYSLAFFLFNIGLTAKAQTTYTVSNINDNGSGSLRAAISAAGNGDIIRFDPSLISGGSDTIILSSEIAFTKGLTIKGLYNDTHALCISGNNANGIFSVNCGQASNKNLLLDSLILINGNRYHGGAVHFIYGDTLIIRNCTIANNTAPDFQGINGSGGGVFFDSFLFPSSIVMIDNSSIVNNSADNSGGGLSVSSFFGSSIKITNSTISDNSADFFGGGLYSFSGIYSFMELSNSTVAHNSADFAAGGLYADSDSTTVSIANSTIANNTARLSSVGGISINSDSSASSLIVKGSIIFNGGTNENIYQSPVGAINSNGYNIFSDAPVGASASDSVNISVGALNLQALANNGGSTKTMMPGRGSIAINTGDSTDTSNAQNGAIEGLRDRGAAEFYCVASKPIVTASSRELTTSAIGTYQWIDCDSLNTPIEGATDSIFNATVNGNYAVIVDDGICVDTSDCISVNCVASKPIITASSSELTTSAIGTYQWIDCDNGNTPLVGATDSTFNALKNGNYAVIVDDGICVDTSDCISVNNIGINEPGLILNEQMINIYPNPSNGKYSVDLGENLKSASMRLTDVHGRTILTEEFSEISSFSFEIEEAAGLYFLTLSSEDQTGVIRLLKK